MATPEIAIGPSSVPAVDAKEQRIFVASQWQLMWWRFRKHKVAVASALVVMGFYLVVLGADFLAYADPNASEAQRSLMPLSDREDFEIELQNGVLQLVFDSPAPAKFVVSPNAPVRQIWVSAMSRSFKLSWSPDASTFVLDGETLSALLERLVGEFLSSGSP